MALVASALACKVKLQYQTGTDLEGNPVYRNKTYSRVKTAAADQDIYDTASGIAALCDDTLNSITRIDDTDLANQA